MRLSPVVFDISRLIPIPEFFFANTSKAFFISVIVFSLISPTSSIIQSSFKEIKRIKDKFGITLNEINLGGGLGVKYTENDKPISVYEIAETIINSIEEHSEKYGIEKLSDITGVA